MAGSAIYPRVRTVTHNQEAMVLTQGNDNSAATSAATQSRALHEPPSDWVQLALAPFHYFGRNGYIRTDEEMREAFQRLVEGSIPVEPPPIPSPGEPPPVPPPETPKIEWELVWLPRRPAIKALGLTLYLFPATGAVLLRDGGTTVFVSGESFDDFLHNSKKWDRVPENQKAWFCGLAAGLRDKMHDRFAACVKDGAAHIMARKNTILASFERVWPDQWEHFELNSVVLVRGKTPLGTILNHRIGGTMSRPSATPPGRTAKNSTGFMLLPG
jgi:hypothetical protein